MGAQSQESGQFTVIPRPVDDMASSKLRCSGDNKGHYFLKHYIDFSRASVNSHKGQGPI